MKLSILLADDEKSVREAIAAELSRAGYEVREARNGEEAVASARDNPPDIVILDVMMPAMNGIEACREIRSRLDDTPVLFLTALEGDENEIQGLEAGADGYIPKTASKEIILARVASAARRVAANPRAAEFDFGKWRVDPLCGRMKREGRKDVLLSTREIEMMRLFSSHPSELFSKEELLKRFWGADFDGQESALGQAVSRLRAKLGDEAWHVDTVYGTGTRFVP